MRRGPKGEKRLADDSEYWRTRAEEFRMVAGQISDLEAKRALLEIADSYEHMAVRAEQRLRDGDRTDCASRRRAPLSCGPGAAPRPVARPCSVSVSLAAASRSTRPFTMAVKVTPVMPAVCRSVPLATQKKVGVARSINSLVLYQRFWFYTNV
jgi:hypothetical protein